MKIAIVGTHGSGKSTLSYLLASEYKKSGKNVKIIQEVARSCPFPINEKMTETTAIWIYLEHLRQEIEAQGKYDIIISDRSCYDSFIYFQNFFRNYCRNQFYENLKASAKEWLLLYDKIILVEADVALQADGIRSSDHDFQKSISSLFDKVFSEISIIRIKSSQIFGSDNAWKYCL